MPKVPTGPYAGAQPGVLKRNQACHQCRKRKLKCDAKRPCSTCVRSHSHALAHGRQNAEFPAFPDCTYDETLETGGPVPDSPQNNYERLENRIAELEALLRQQAGPTPPTSYDSSSPSESGLNLRRGETPSFSGVDTVMDSSNYSSNFPSPLPRDVIGEELTQDLTEQPFLPRDTDILTPELGVLWPQWPKRLPRPDLLRHLVESFFAYHPHASRLIHMPTFMISLSLPPNHPDFPVAPLLHAICAVSSMYTAAVTSKDTITPAGGDIFVPPSSTGRPPESFAAQQVAFAKQLADEYVLSGRHLFQCLQAYLLIVWYYWSNSRWVDLFISCGYCMRVVVPLGLNVDPVFRPVAETTSTALLPAAQSVIEEELRRNTFWLAYALDRQHGCATGWAMALDDEDITQHFPVSKELFERGHDIPSEIRPWSHIRSSLLTHPPGQTDSFTLYIKCAVILSRVKKHNHRSGARRFRGDIGATPVGTDILHDALDPRTAPDFMDIEDLVYSFRESWPSHLKDPFANGTVDTYMFTTVLSFHVAMILLHEPYGIIQSPTCSSAAKMLVAARGILSSLYALWSSTFDFMRLDYPCIFSFYLAGRILCRFLRAATDAGSREQVDILTAEVEFVFMFLHKMGQRVPLSNRYWQMLQLTVVKICGEDVNIDTRGSGSCEVPIFPIPFTAEMAEQIYAAQHAIPPSEDLFDFDFIFKA